MILPFAGGVSPPLPVVSLLFSASYPQASRSYYLLFNYLFFTTCFRVSRFTEGQSREVSRFTESQSRAGIPFHRKPLWRIVQACGENGHIPQTLRLFGES